MLRIYRRAAGLVVLLALLGLPAAGDIYFRLTPFASGLNSPVGLVEAGDTRLFVVEQAGTIRIALPDGTILPTPFLDITARVDSSSNEEGLLGLAFHPGYAGNGELYVNYTNTTGGIRRTRISRFTVTANPDVADPGSEVILLTVEQPFSNHNAGDIAFGPDGFLYVPLGDGGSGGDPGDNAQNDGVLLGKVSRIDVDGGGGSPPDCIGLGSGGYTVPASNPFLDGAGGTCDEIWAKGLRNPWRSSFDSSTGDLWIADVGQNEWEEIDLQPASSTGGENYGWRCYEGNHPYNLAGCGAIESYTFPAFEYDHASGCSVVGGYVYRGAQYPGLVGRYLLTDYCTGYFWDLVDDGGGGWTATQHFETAGFGYVAFGQNQAGAQFVVNLNGTISRVEANVCLGADADGDGICDASDNCPNDLNPNQEDGDGDGVGDACDICPGFDDNLDGDGDGVPDGCDVCVGDDASGDSDGDGVCDDIDLCTGDDASGDGDGDGFCSDIDNCPGTPNPGQEDGDDDGFGDACDICPGFDDTIDGDGDGVPDGCDVCVGDDATGDSDGDGICDDLDLCIGSDGSGDGDGDGFCSDLDNCPGTPNPGQEDGDGDGVGDVCDVCPGFDDNLDGDGDGVPDGCDLCTGDDASGDSDGDGVCDDLDFCSGDDATGDSDGDGICDDLDCGILDPVIGACGSCSDPATLCIFADGFESGDTTGWTP